MSSNDQALKDLETWAQPLVKALGAAEQRRLRREIARELLRRQRKRIAAQRNPDGSAYEKRREQKAQSNPPQRFLYTGPWSSSHPKPRVAQIKSYRAEGDRMIGYDIEARGIRTFLKKNVIRYLRPTSTAPAKSPRPRKRIKAMFQRMKGKMRVLPDASGAAVGFTGKTARIATVHQRGLRDQVRPGKSADYPVRELLGFGAGDMERVREMILERLAKA